MKFHCSVDGIHFVQDFEKTFVPPCNFWGDLGMANLQEDLKRKFWDWLFSMPADEIGIKAKIGISVEFKTGAISEYDWFKSKVLHYNDWTELQQQEFQRQFFNAMHKGENMEKWIDAFNIKDKQINAD